MNVKLWFFFLHISKSYMNGKTYTGCPTQDATSGNPFLVTFPVTKPGNSFTFRTARILSLSGTFVWIIFFEIQWFPGPAKKNWRFKIAIFCLFLPTTFPPCYSSISIATVVIFTKVRGGRWWAVTFHFFCFYWYYCSQVCRAGDSFWYARKSPVPSEFLVTTCPIRNVTKGCRKW